MTTPPEFKDLLGKTLTKCHVSDNKNEVIFTTTEGKSYQLYHEQMCCETVLVDDICGNLEDLVGSPLIQAEESSNEDENNNLTWTFYRLATVKGQVVMTWRGESNGYYSERVSFDDYEFE